MHSWQGLRCTFGDVSTHATLFGLKKDVLTYFQTEKYLPALKCLLAIQSANPAHPQKEDLAKRLRTAIDQAGEPLPKPAQQAMEELFLNAA